MCMITSAVLIGMEALDGKELFAIEGSRDNPEEREKCVRAAENPLPPPLTASKNNVQIFKCELRREVRVHRHDENM